MSGILNNRSPNDYSLHDLLDLFRKDVMLTFNAHHIGTVQSFDADAQTATVTVNYKKTFVEKQDDGTYAAVLKPYPIITDCPVIVLGGGTSSLTFPIAQGDECILLFNDRDIDTWFQGNNGAGPASNRLHSFSDAVALVGLRSLNRVMKDYDLTRAVLRYGGGMVGVSDGRVKIANDTTTLNTLLQNLITAIKTISTTNTVPGSPATLNPGSVTALTAIATQIQGLLE